MTPATEPRVLQTLDGAPWDIEAYRKVGGYEAWRRCVKELSANDIVNELKKAGLRGRGGAGFPQDVAVRSGLVVVTSPARFSPLASTKRGI